MSEGLCGLFYIIPETEPSELDGRLTWPVMNALEGKVFMGPVGCMGGSKGDLWYIASDDGTVVRKGTWLGGYAAQPPRPDGRQ